MRLLIAVMVAGGLGSGFRFIVATTLTRVTGGVFPWGTLAVNLAGCLAFGVISELGLEHRWMSREVALALTAGFLGGLTTFSSFAYESFRMVERREVLLMAVYASASMALGLIAVWAGMRLARSLF